MQIKYQLVIIGSENNFKNNIVELLIKRVSDLGLNIDTIIILDENNFSEYKGNAPTVVLYFGDDNLNFINLNILNKLISDACFILPIVSDIQNFNNLIPKELSSINGFELKSENEIESLVSRILEGLSLLRESRRLFISYRRKESAAAAIQLYEELDKSGFDVFLDTHSIKSGEQFQDMLWHRLVDTDVLILLHTIDFLDSIWTKAEIDTANSMSIGMIQLVWPGVFVKPDKGFLTIENLTEGDFENNIFANKESRFTESTLKRITIAAESLRARNLASRQDNLIEEFIDSANSNSLDVTLQPEKFISLKNSKGDDIEIIPTVGVPNAFTYNQKQEFIETIKAKDTQSIYLLYDDRNILKKWIAHLAWLDSYLPVKAIKISEITNWINKL